VTSSAPAAPAVREVTSEIRRNLDAVDKLEPGRGQLDLGAYVRGYGDTGIAGGLVDYQHRVTPRASVFGQGTIGYGWGETKGLHYQALAGLRMRF
jgi:hypothetical protein